MYKSELEWTIEVLCINIFVNTEHVQGLKYVVARLNKASEGIVEMVGHRIEELINILLVAQAPRLEHRILMNIALRPTSRINEVYYK